VDLSAVAAAVTAGRLSEQEALGLLYGKRRGSYSAASVRAALEARQLRVERVSVDAMKYVVTAKRVR
jgi:hypothetical protein